MPDAVVGPDSEVHDAPGRMVAEARSQYEHIKDSELDAGWSEARAEEIAARTVNKERAEKGETKAARRRANHPR